jgi:hypothetical protein
MIHPVKRLIFVGYWGNSNIALAGTARNIANFQSVLIAEDVVP